MIANFITIARTSFNGVSTYPVGLIKFANIHLEDLIFMENGLKVDLVEEYASNFIDIEGIYSQKNPEEFTPTQCLSMLKISTRYAV